MPELLPPPLEHYIARHTTPEPPYLAALNRSTHLKAMLPQMLSGHVQGRVLSMISHMVRPMRILEIGTYTGYSALCLAEGLQPGGTLITIDINEELTPMVQQAIASAGMQDRIDVRIGNAANIIPQLEGTFDLVFIDADKIQYAHYFDLVIDRVPVGGYILADNVLWSGKILDAHKDKDTAAIDAFNKKVHADPRVETVILSVRDGITLMRKVS